MGGRLRVAVLADRSLTEWQQRALEYAREQVDVNYKLVVVDESTTERTSATSYLRAPVQLYREYGFWPLVILDYSIWARLSGNDGYYNQRQRVPIKDVAVLSDAEHIPVEPLVEDAWREIPTPVVDRLREECDVAIRFGFGLLCGDILDAPKYGVLSFHPADITEYRGQGPEQTFIQDDDVGGSTLQRLSESIDGGEIIARCHIDVSDARTLEEVWRRINELQIQLLSDGLANLLDSEFSPEQPRKLGEYHSHTERNRLAFVYQTLCKNYLGRLQNLLG